MRPSEAVLAPAGSRSFFCSNDSSIKTLFLALWLSLWTSQLTCCALSPMPTLFWHTSPSIHKRWFCFWKRKVNTKSMLTRACFMETIAHLGIAFLKTEKEKKCVRSDAKDAMPQSTPELSFLSGGENRYECLTLNKGHNGFFVLPAATSVWLCSQDAQCCVDRGWGGPLFPGKQLRSKRREGFVSGTWNDQLRPSQKMSPSKARGFQWEAKAWGFGLLKVGIWKMKCLSILLGLAKLIFFRV